MSFIITRPGKTQLILENPVMPAAGTFGYGNLYYDMVNLKKIGAVVTNPVTYHSRKPANGVRVVPLDSGVLVHTGLPNTGVSKVIKRWRDVWRLLPVPTILHLAATSPDDVTKSMEFIETADTITAVELGLEEDLPPDEAERLTSAAVRNTEKPVLVRLPLASAYEIAEAVADAGAGALVVGAPPRGTARDPISGKLITGRVYSPVVKTLSLQLVQRLAGRMKDIPIVGAGGIHTQQDARDFITAGAVAVQVDSVMWVLPRMIEIIGRDLGGWILTRETGALADEWFTGIGNTDVLDRDQDLYDDEAARE